MTAEKAKEVVEKHLKNNKPVLEYAIGNTEDTK
jgi:(2Fe-2S) ferredoxin